MGRNTAHIAGHRFNKDRGYLAFVIGNKPFDRTDIVISCT